MLSARMAVLRQSLGGPILSKFRPPMGHGRISVSPVYLGQMPGPAIHAYPIFLDIVTLPLPSSPLVLEDPASSLSRAQDFEGTVAIGLNVSITIANG